MAKKKKDDGFVKPELEAAFQNKRVDEPQEKENIIDPEVLDKARKEMREAMKEKFGKWITVYDEDATDADIEAARNYFETEVKKYQEQTYSLADNKEEALETTMFLLAWNEHHNHWKNAVWRGVISFDTVMKKTLADLEAEENEIKSVDIDYQTLMFLYHQMQTPEGVGLAAAYEMAELENYNVETNKINDGAPRVTYTSVLSKVYEHVNRLSIVDKMLNLIRERVAIAAAGIKFDFKITELEEFKELSDAWVTSDTDQQMKNV